MRIATVLCLALTGVSELAGLPRQTRPKACDTAEIADDIFVGRLDRIGTNQARVPHTVLDTWGIEPLLSLHFSVIERFAGVGGKELEVDVLANGRNYPYRSQFRVGGNYLIYAKRRGADLYAQEEEPPWSHMLSAPGTSLPVEEAEEDLRFLRTTSQLPRSHDVTGFVEDAYPTERGLFPWAPPVAYLLAQSILPSQWAHTLLRGISLRLTGEKGSRYALSDGSGAFRFPSVPAGTYHLTFDDENLGSKSANDIHVIPGGCHTWSPPVLLARGVVGHLATKGQEGNSGIALDLVPADRRLSNKRYVTQTDNAGNFEFRNVSEGDYQLGMSLTSAAGERHPYKSQAYPEVVHVRSSPQPLRFEFRLTEPRRDLVRVVKVSLLWPDGSAVRFPRLYTFDQDRGQIELLDFDPTAGTYSFAAYSGSIYSTFAEGYNEIFGARWYQGAATDEELRRGVWKIVLRNQGMR